jgi:dTDP-4-amino-4,6-dideoxygalactose transaminase
VATTSSIVWEGCRPVFVDIDPLSLNIDAAKIESAITPETSAILATHVYGNPCDIESIDLLAKKYNLKVIYDAAHCFGTKYKNKSLFSYGDISTTSFHASKLFQTIEGGAVFTNDPDLLKKMSYLRNFGHEGHENFAYLGINGKNSEFHAAMGLCNLPYIDSVLKKAKSSVQVYNQKLKGLNVKNIAIKENTIWNSAYYPVLFPTEKELLKAVQQLNNNWIYPRRYFYPSLNKVNYLPYVSLPVAEEVSARILCLPLYFELKEEDISFIARILLRAQNYQ